MRRPRKGQRMVLCPFADGLDVTASEDESCFPAALGAHLEPDEPYVPVSVDVVLPIASLVCILACCVICYMQHSYRNVDTVKKVNRPDNLDLMATDNVDFNTELDETGHMHSIKSAPEQSRSPNFTASVKAGVPLRALHSQQADYL